MRVIDPKSELLSSLFGDLTKDAPESRKRNIAYLNHTKENYNILTHENHNEYYKNYQETLPVYPRERAVSILKVKVKDSPEIKTEQELIDKSISSKHICTPIKQFNTKGQGKKRRIFVPKYRLDMTVPWTNYNAGILPPINKRLISLYKNNETDKRSLSVNKKYCMTNQYNTPQAKLSSEKKIIIRKNAVHHFSTQDRTDNKSIAVGLSNRKINNNKISESNENQHMSNVQSSKEERKY